MITNKSGPDGDPDATIADAFDAGATVAGDATLAPAPESDSSAGPGKVATDDGGATAALEGLVATPDVAAAAPPDDPAGTIADSLAAPKLDLAATVMGTERFETVALADDPTATIAVTGLRGGDRAGLAARPGVGSPSGRSRFKIVRPHARGGLGEVFVAVDDELNREVALKEIQGRHADDAVSRARFVVEAEVTGGLEHPGIVPVYGLGAYQDGRPYYAMRFIRGDSLKEAIEAYHKADATPGGPSTLDLHKLLRRFVDVCNAIDYAHSRGVIHRDIKPANVMLGPFGETLVVDWGLAKPLGVGPEAGSDHGPDMSRAAAQARSEAANPGEGRLRPLSASGSMYAVLFGSTVGTPHYMSPEQADGETDALGPASDIYSLGATLYCLLAGRAPFTERSLEPLLRKVRAGEFDPPRTVRKDIPPALEAVCLKAMARVPGDRYASARELAEDVEHWAADEPVSAYSEPWTAKAGRWARRHRTLVTTSAALLVAAVFGLTTAALLIDRERRQTDHYFTLARSAVDTLLTEFGAVQLVDIPGAEQVRARMLGRASVFYEEFLRRGRRPSVYQGAGQAYARLGDVQEQLGRYPEAETNLRHAQTLLGPLVQGRGPEADDFRRDLARARHSLGILLTRAARYDEAQTELSAAIDLRRELAARPNAPAQDRADEQESVYRLGALLARRPGNRGKAQEYYGVALKEAEARVKAADDAAKVPPDEARRRLARYQNQLATLLSRSDDAKSLDQALGLLDTAFATQSALRGKADSVAAYAWDLARTRSNIASVRRKREHAGAAGVAAPNAETDPVLAEYTASVVLLRRLVNDYPSVPDYRFELAEVLLNRARRYQTPLRLQPQAVTDLTEALKLLDVLAAEQPERPDYALRRASARRRLSALSAGPAKPDAAVVGLRRALAELRAIPKTSADYARSIDYRAELTQAVATLAGLVRKDPAALADLAPDLDEASKTGLALLKAEGDNPEVLRATYNNLYLLASVRRAQRRFADAARASLDSAPLLGRSSPGTGAAWKVAAEAASILTGAADPALTARLAPEVVDLLRQARREGVDLAPVVEKPEFKALDGVKEFQDLKRAVTSKPASG